MPHIMPPISNYTSVQSVVADYVTGKVSTAYDVIVTHVEMTADSYIAEFVYKAHTGQGYFTAKVKIDEQYNVVEELEEVK